MSSPTSRIRHASGLWECRTFLTTWDADQTQWAKARLDRSDVSADDFDRLRVAGVVTDGPVPGNRLVTVGLNALTARLITTAPVWSASSGGAPGGGTGFVLVGVGTATAADQAADSDLGGTRAYRVCDDTYPVQSNGAMTAKATFQSAEANFAWESYGLFVPASGASAVSGTAAVALKPSNYTMLNRKAPAGLGTKSSGTTASLTVTITISSS